MRFWTTLFRRKSLQAILDDHARDVAQSEKSGTGLKKVLGVWDLTVFGVAALVGAGVFSTIGNAAYHGGPAVTLLFVFTAIACGLCALCYAEFASRVPVAGSAYTYSYMAFGEFIAWVIGWDLLMEYAIGDIAITISWSQYFVGLLKYYGLQMPSYFTMDFLSAYRGHEAISQWLSQGISLADIPSQIGFEPLWLKGYEAWLSAPRFFELPIVCDLPAFLVTIFITWIILMGIEDSRNFSRLMVFLKLAVIAFVIGLGIFYIDPSHWVPFAPNGPSGVLRAVSAVFFAYIGFDVISTCAEECRDPQRDLPKAMIYSLLICTFIYVVLALVITGVVSSAKLQVADPLAFIFGSEGANIPWFSGVIAFTAVLALAGVLLVYQLGQTRIWMVMGRDGLLPPAFSKLHPKFKTPWFSTLLSGVLVAIPSLFLNLTEVTDLNSIGTLFAFVLVSAGVLLMDPKHQDANKRFRIPYINSRYLYPGLALFVGGLLVWLQSRGYITVLPWEQLLSDSKSFFHHLPILIFMVGVFALSLLCLRYQLSFIPVMALTLSSYLITELGMKTWLRFGIWLAVGCVLYFAYGFRHSRLNKR